MSQTCNQMKVTVKEITSHRGLRKFVHFPNELYKDNPYYVPQIEIIDVNTFDPQKNRAFEVCDAKFWLAYDENDKVVGRIAGIINHRYNEKVGEKICRFGWIDFIDSQEVVKALLDTVESFARENGMDQIEGPDGLLEFDVTGVLVDGFDQIPTPYGKYNDPYYEPRILAEGYEQSTDYVEFLITIPETLPEKHARLVDIVKERYGLRQAEFTKKKEIIPYLDGGFECMNRCYSSLHGFSELSKGQSFMLSVKGDSMINAGIFSGDRIIVRQQSTAENGEMVVALIDDSATVKTYYKEKDHIRLQPENDTMDPIIVDSCTILGKVYGVIRIFR